MKIALLAFWIVLAWLALAAIAYWVAPDDRKPTFFFFTLLLGPLGALGAAVATATLQAGATGVLASDQRRVSG